MIFYTFSCSKDASITQAWNGECFLLSYGPIANFCTVVSNKGIMNKYNDLCAKNSNSMHSQKYQNQELRPLRIAVKPSWLTHAAGKIFQEKCYIYLSRLCETWNKNCIPVV